MKKPRDTNMSRGHGSESWDSDGGAPVTIRIGLVRRRGLGKLYFKRVFGFFGADLGLLVVEMTQ